MNERKRKMNTIKNQIKNKKLWLLDMDGTLYLENDLFENCIEFLNCIKEKGGKYLFLTNNSSKSTDKYVEKLSKLGINAYEDDFLTSTNATILYLKSKGYKKIYAFGTKSFVKQLKDADLCVTENVEEGIDCLCISNDTELTFKKLDDASILLLNDKIDYIATNPDWVCPTSYGYVPDCGSFCQMLENAVKRKPRFIGKPEPEMALLAMEKSGYKKDETVIVGDRIYTDIACGINAGIYSALVMSGESTQKTIDESETKPTAIFENISEIYKIMNNLSIHNS